MLYRERLRCLVSNLTADNTEWRPPDAPVSASRRRLDVGRGKQNNAGSATASASLPRRGHREWKPEGGEERWIPPPRRRRQGRRPCRRRTTSAPSATTASGSRVRRTAPIGSVASPFHYPASSPFLPPRASPLFPLRGLIWVSFPFSIRLR